MPHTALSVIRLFGTILLCIALSDSTSKDPFSQQPRISVENGHLILRGGENKNITMLSSGDGKVVVNNVDFSTLFRMANTAISDKLGHSSTIKALKKNVHELASQMQSLSTIADQVRQLEENVTNLITRFNASVGSRSSNFRLRAVQRKVTSLESQVRTLTGYLNKDDCGSNPCRNGGTCIDGYNAYICQCPSNWEGLTCETDVNECSRYAGTSSGCQNGATCYNSPGGYRCECASNWYGIHCTQSHDDCSTASHVELCGHGTCINEKRIVPGQPKYRCLCDEGWTRGASQACDQDIDECSSNRNTCSKNPPVQCINLPGTFHCGHCPLGYTGNGQSCSDINECSVNNGGCHPLVMCLNTLGSRQCGPCPIGFIGDGTYCMSSGVCSNNNGGCHPLATCTANSAITGTYRECRCPTGYVGNGEGLTGCQQGQSMTCASSPCIHGTCQMTTSSYHCICFTGYIGQLCDQPANPCSSQPCQNGGTCTSQSIGFTCACTQNYEGPTCSIERQGCGGHIVANNGTLTYPNTGLEYRHHENCAWIIVVENNKVININLNAIHMEQSPSCVFDFLQLNDGGLVTSHLLQRYCGIDVRIGQTVQSTHSEVYVWFHTDQSHAGYGFTITWNATDALCGENLEPAPYGAISSPGYPGKYPRNRDCFWRVRATPGSRLQFHFATLKLEHHSNCSFDFLKIFDGPRETDPVLKTYCTTMIPAPLISSGSAALLHFHSDAFVEDLGFHITYSSVPAVHGCGGTLTTPSGTISSPTSDDTQDQPITCEWLIRVHPENRISLTFLAFHTLQCSVDYVEVHDGPSVDSQLLGRYCGLDIPGDLISNSHQIVIKFHTDSSVQYNNFKLSYQTICGGTYTDLQGSFTSPNFPDFYPSRSTCLFYITLPPGNLIQLQFPVFALQDSEPCNFDFIQIRDGVSEQSELLGQYCGESPPDMVTSNYNELLVKFIADGSVTNNGFIANYTNIVIGCGGVLSTNRGSVTTPAHPNFYPPSITCNWIIRAPPGHVVQLTFDAFVLEAQVQCNYDYVIVSDSDGAMIGNRYCGTRIPPILTSTDNTMKITFVADDSILREGFNASYIFLDSSQTCGGSFYLESGVIRSPAFPHTYPHNRDCTWILHAENGHQITLNVSSFHLENHRNCKFDFLEIRNGGSNTSPLVGRYCGERILSSFISHGNQFWLKFSSDRSRTAPGFEIFYDTITTGCGGTLKSPTGSIISSNYPLPYGHNAECSWIIRISEGSSISLYIVDVDIEQHATCQYDYLAVYDGDSDNAKLLTKMCNNQQHPDAIRSTNNVIFVKFRTDISESGRGFHLTYHSVCNNLVSKRRGVIESPNFPNTYPHNHNCTWTIQAPQGSNISISFSHLFLEHSTSCYADYIEVNQTSARAIAPTRLAKFCGTPFPLPSAIMTSTNMATVSLVTDSSVTREGFRLEYAVQGCGGDVTRFYSVITSPNYPDAYPTTTECTWNVKYPPGSRVQLEIQELYLEYAHSCMYDYLKIYSGEDENSPLVMKVCDRISSSTMVVSHGSNMLIHFYSDEIIVGKGFKAVIRQLSSGCGGRFTSKEGNIFSPSYPSNYNASDECDYLISVENTHVVSLEFYEFSFPESINCTKGYVAVFDGQNSSMPLLAKFCGEKNDDAVVNATSNVMLVRLRGDGINDAKGFRAHYKSGCGRRIIADGGGVLTTPAFPHMSANTFCHWIVSASDPGQKVTLVFSNFHVKWQCQGNTTYLEVRDGDTADSPLVGRYCGPEAPHAIVSEGHALHLTTFSYGIFRASYGITSSYCGGDLSSMSGSFSSPGFPNNYPMGTECIWIISASAGNKVQISFRSFSLTESDYCNMDYVEIHEDSASGPLIGRYCNQIPGNVTAAHRVWIKFRSDEFSTGAGFQAYYSLVYGNELNGTNGVIESPGYPLGDFTAVNIQWLVTVPPNNYISIQFTDIFISKRRNFNCGPSVMIYDGDSEDTGSLLGEFCGYIIPEPVISHGNQVLIKYNALYYLSSKWRLHWNAVSQYSVIQPPPPASVCWKEIFLNASEGIEFTSPGYPVAYPSNTNCTWMITAPSYERVLLNFTSIIMEGYQTYCSYDYINVYTASDPYVDSWILNTTLCGRRNATIIAPSNVVKVKFISDRYTQYTGFHAVATPVCGGHLRGSSGHLSSSEILSHIALHQETGVSFNCEWIIMVKNRRTIEISFDSFNLPSDDTCSDMFIKVLNGAQVTSPLLGGRKYCGTSEPSIPHTSSNVALIVLNIGTFSRGSPSFVLHFKEISVACGGHLYLSEDERSLEIQSPNYPNSPPHPVECIWIIMSPSGTRMRVDFDADFHLSSPCYDSYDKPVEYVELRDGGTEMAELLQRLCGSRHPSSQVTSGNNLYVVYTTQVDHPGIGFKASIQTAECGGVVSGYYGSVASPNYPMNYSNGQECEWTLKTIPDRHLSLYLIALDTPKSADCIDTDYIEIRESKNGDLIERYCGDFEDLSDTQVNVALNSVYVKFKTDSSRTGKGFRLSFSASNNYCGSYFTGPSGAISSPNYPLAVQQTTYCHWVIVAPEGRVVTITFSNFNLPRDPNTNACINRLSVTHLNRQRGFNICGTDLPEPIVSNTSTLILRMSIHSLAAGEGFSLEFSTERESDCGGVLLPPSGLITVPSINLTEGMERECKWMIDSESDNSTVVIKFDILDIPGSLAMYCSNSYLIIRGSYSFVGYFCGNMTERHPVVLSSHRQTKLLLYSNLPQFMGGIHATYNISDCGGILYGSDIEIMSPGYPSGYAANVDCHWIIKVPWGDQVKIAFLDMRMEENCNKDYVIIRNGQYTSSPVIGRFCGTNQPHVITSDQSSVSVTFHSDESGTAPGFKLTTSDIQTGCGGLIHAPSGTITSLNYPQRYDNDVECIWTIETTLGNHVNLTFVERFDVEMSNNCEKDYLLIEDFKTGTWQELSRLCGSQMPKTHLSSGTKIRLTFHTNQQIQGDGFKINFKSNCGGQFPDGSGAITSPNYPEFYGTNLDCSYIVGESDRYTHLVFDPTKFSLENEPNCNFDFISVFPSTSSAGSAHVKYCGNNAPVPLTILGQVTVHFHSDYDFSGHGFIANYEISDCGGLRSEEFGEIRSPTPVSYANNMDCTWAVLGKPNKVIALRFSEFKVESHSLCHFDYLAIYDGNGTSDNLIGRLCGIELPPIIKTTSNMMTIHWRTDSSVTMRGFVAHYYNTVGINQGCGGLLTTASGEITSVDFDNDGKYEPDLDCIWHLSVVDGLSIELSFSAFNLEEASNGNCLFDFVEIRDGWNSFDPLITRLCGNSLPTLIRSSGNKISLIFHTDSQTNMPGFRANYSSVPTVCGTSIHNSTNMSQVLSSPNYPQAFPSGIFCRWQIFRPRYNFNHMLMVSLDNLDIPCANGYVEVQSYNMVGGPFRLCGPSHPLNFVTFRNIWINFYSTVNSESSKGFSLTYKLTSCSINYTADNGVLFNKFFPSPTYRDNCSILIQTDPGRTISLYFQQFYFAYPPNPDCHSGNITVYDGETPEAPVLGTFCGILRPDPVFSTGHSLLFKSSSLSSALYYASYTTTDKGRGCGGTLSHTNGTFSSPFYPTAYNQSSECSWLLLVPGHHTLTLTFEFFSLNSTAGCATNYIEVYEGNSATPSNRVTRYCGDDFPAPHVSQGSQILVVLVTNVTNAAPGFLARFEMNSIELSSSHSGFVIEQRASQSPSVFNGRSIYMDIW